MLNWKSVIILFIHRNTLQVNGGNLTGIVSAEIPQTILRDGDIISADGAYTLIKQLVKQYSLTGTQVYIVISDSLYFDKLFPPAQQVSLENDVLNFFNVVPYETVMSRVYDTANGKHAVAINKNFFETFRQGFALQGIPVKAIVPSFMIAGAEGKRSLDVQLSAAIMKNIDNLIKFSINETQDSGPVLTGGNPVAATPSKKKSQLPLLLAVFGVLIVILVIVILLQPH